MYLDKEELYVDRQDEYELDETNIDEGVEIVDLVDEEALNGITEQHSFAPPAKHTQQDAHFTLRQRHLQLLVTVTTIGLLLCALLNSYAPMRDRLVQTFVPPAPTENGEAEPSVESFYFDANPTWGQLFVDGKRVMHLPLIARANDKPLQLKRGKHLLRWIVAPFVSQQCSVTVPFNTTTDTCHFDLFTRYTGGMGAWLFRFPISLAQLPHPEFTNLVAAVQTELDTHAPTETVLPGEVYAVNITGESIRRATVPMKATLRYQLDVENNLDGICSTILEASTPCTYNGQECYLFCGIPLLPQETQTPSWDVFAAVQATWEYSTQDGTILAQNQPELLGTTVVYDHLIPLHITWDGIRWHVRLRTFQATLPGTQQQLDVSCNTALNTVTTVLVPTNSVQAHVGINWEYISGPNPAEGCLSIATLQDRQDTVSAYCLHRFGVFLAANEIAHRYWPNLPVADAHEKGLASQLAALQYHT